MTTPSLLATMVAALALEGHERVLEVGIGLGYQAAVLGRLAGELWSIGRRAELAAAATADLAQFRGAPGERLIRVRVIARVRFAVHGRHGFASGARDAAADGE